MPHRPRKASTSQSNTIYIGVDPGKKGGLSWINNKNEGECLKMPDTERDIWDWFTELPKGDKVCVIEKVWAAPVKGKRQGTTSMFSFGQSYGLLRAYLIAAGITFQESAPVTWQKAFNLRAKKSFPNDRHWKKYLKGIAQQLFPKIKVTLEPADSLLLADYCRRLNNGH